MASPRRPLGARRLWLVALTGGPGRGQPSSPAWDEGGSPGKAGLALQVLHQRKQDTDACGGGVGKAGEGLGVSVVIIRQQPGQCRDGNAGEGWGPPARGAVSAPPSPHSCECCFSPPHPHPCSGWEEGGPTGALQYGLFPECASLGICARACESRVRSLWLVIQECGRGPFARHMQSWEAMEQMAPP